VVIELNNAVSSGHSIRPATADDLADIVDIWSEGQIIASELGVPPTRDQVARFYMQYLSDAERSPRIWVATTEIRTILGWQALLPNRPHPTFSQSWAQSSTYIRQEAQGRGLGIDLLNFAMQLAPSIGIRHILGYIREDNAASIRLVERLKWQRVGMLPQDDGDALILYHYLTSKNH
jgi:L-amino acid N-acyltransferase YncA